MSFEQANFENKPTKEDSKEKILTPRERLLSLEKEGIFVFHGTPEKVEFLEPHQSYTGKNKEKHGDAAVCAADTAETAIFRAIINIKNFPKGGSNCFGFNEDGSLDFGMEKNYFENLSNKKGLVYVLPKSEFKRFEDRGEWRSEKPVMPVEVVFVTEKDLPKNIQLIDKNFKKIS
ncbi:MAG: hypothetical protein FJZ05_01310 [Candidatus Nealsonbacteria bacterium]|nr:hypothetical protein [Candidatus Nealsonbacteria bacterium]